MIYFTIQGFIVKLNMSGSWVMPNCNKLRTVIVIQNLVKLLKLATHLTYHSLLLNKETCLVPSNKVSVYWHLLDIQLTIEATAEDNIVGKLLWVVSILIYMSRIYSKLSVTSKNITCHLFIKHQQSSKTVTDS